MNLFSQTGVFPLLAHATFTVKLVLALLSLMSVVSWSIIIYKYFLLSSARKRSGEDVKIFQSTRVLGDAMRTLSKNASSPVYRTGAVAMNEIRRLESAGLLTAGGINVVMDTLRRALRQGVKSQLGRLSRSLPFLATCSNAAPFIGLFGTVWGIMHSFHAIGRMKTAALSAVAPGISEALIATAIGLAVAIPATIAYNFFLGVLNDIEIEMVNFAGAFLNKVQRELSRESNTPGSRRPGRFSSDGED